MSDDEDARTLWCGNLSEKITHEILYELFLQAGPLENLRIPRDREGRPRNFAFITYSHIESCPYAIELFRGTELYERKLSLKRQNTSSGNMNGHGPSAKILDSENARLRGRPLQNGNSNMDVEQNFTNMTNHMIANGIPSNLPLFGSYEHHQPGGLSNASLQGQWTARHPPQWDDRRHEAYRSGGRDRDRSRGNRDRSRSERDWGDREGDGGGRQDRHNPREDLRQRLDRFPRDEPRDHRNRNRGNNYNRSNANFSRD